MLQERRPECGEAELGAMCAQKQPRGGRGFCFLLPGSRGMQFLKRYIMPQIEAQTGQDTHNYNNNQGKETLSTPVRDYKERLSVKPK